MDKTVTGYKLILTNRMTNTILNKTRAQSFSFRRMSSTSCSLFKFLFSIVFSQIFLVYKTLIVTKSVDHRYAAICLRAYPTSAQKNILSQWMGCARTLWNAKCDDERYMTRFALKYCPLGTYAPVDQTYAQYKNKECTPWLFECPSQVLRHAAAH